MIGHLQGMPEPVELLKALVPSAQSPAKEQGSSPETLLPRIPDVGEEAQD